MEDRWNPANFDVTNLNDLGAGSLRAAITAAEAAAGADTITFGANQNGVISLATVLPTITQDVTIQGPTAAGTSVTVQRVAAASFRIFTIAPPAANPDQVTLVTINKLTIANGATVEADENGGAIKVLKGKLTLNDCTVQNSDAFGDGGGIWVGGSGNAELTLNGTKVLNNRANGLGGGIAMSMSKATIQAKSDVSNNTSLQRGGGIYLNGINNLGERLTIDDSTVTGNTATDKGGGICAEWLGAGNVNVAVLTKTKVDNNRAINGGAGGYYNGTTTSMDNQSSVSFNKSGDRNGLGIVAGAQGKLTAVGTKVQGNQYFPPPGVGGGGGGGGPGSAFADDGQASAVYVELGAEVILSGCEITGNDGHGVVGFVTSLGYNIVDNSITSSAGWIGSDTVT